jgi:hypothetical protein
MEGALRKIICFILFFQFVGNLWGEDASSIKLRSKVAPLSKVKKSSFFFAEFNFSLNHPYNLYKTVKYYDKIFSKPTVYPEILWNYGIRYKNIEPFVGVRLGYFSTTGSALNPKTKEKISGSDGASYSLTMIPMGLQLGSSFLIWEDYIRLGVYGDYREVYIENVREDKEDDDDDDPLEIDRGWNKAFVYGFSISFRFDQLSSKSHLSIKRMGLESLYVRVFYERGSNISGNKLWGNRVIRKIYFPLESIGVSFGAQIY